MDMQINLSAGYRLFGQLTYESEVQRKIDNVQTVRRGNKNQIVRKLGISRDSLYYRHRMPAKDRALRREIEKSMREIPGYGSPRVAMALGINRKRAARVMRKHDLKPARRGNPPRKRADEGKEAVRYPCIPSKMSPADPDYKWASDFTFII